MDEPALRGLLPAERVAEVGGARLGMVHDGGPRQGRAGRLLERFPGCEAVVYGHTHMPEVSREGDVWIVNPGSPTERRRAPAHTMATIERDAGRLRPHLVELRA
jgi:predicted phosphodiesterase